MEWPFFSKKNIKETIYLGLFLKQEEGVCLLLELGREGIKIIRREKFIYSNNWDNLTEDVDEVLFRIEKETKKTVKETIFFIYSHLINEKTGNIVQSYLNKIKSLSKDLELKPIGYLECHEAVVPQIEKEEQLSLTAIVLELDIGYVGLFIYKGGHVVYSKKIVRTDNIVDDLELTFLAIKDKILLPSRILIYSSVNLSDLSVQIVSYRWKQEIFIQTPKVEIIGEEQIYRSLANLFYQQLINKKGVSTDYSQLEEEKVMGFVIGQEIDVSKENSNSDNKKPENFFIKVKNQFFQLLNIIKIPRLSMNISLIIGLFLIVISFFLGEFFLHKADVVIYVPTKEVQKKLLLTGSSINIYYATKSADLKVNKTTTGKKIIGDNAKGEITIHNYDDKDKTVAKNTTIESGGIRFTLDDEIKVLASTFATDGSKISGKAKVKVTASAIGPESNLGKGQRFTVDDLPSSLFYAINESTFSGGSQKETRTVAKNDYENLKIQALDQGKKSLEENKKNNNDKEKMIFALTEYKLDSLEFSKEIGEEATEVQLKTKIISSYYGYIEGEMLRYFQGELKKVVPSGYLVDSDKIIYKIEKANKEKNKIELTITAKSKSFKDIKTTDVLTKIAGKNKAQVETVFNKDFQLSGFKINIKPNFFFFESRLPFFKRNINLTISSL